MRTGVMYVSFAASALTLAGYSSALVGPVRPITRGWGRDIRIIAGWLACVGIALLTTGCDPAQDYNYYRQGIGTNVYNSAIAAETYAQDAYLNALCEQSGLQLGPYIAGAFSCLPTVQARDWNTIVQAGFNDIDERCDAYLAWLDEQRRLKGPILNELNVVSVAAQNIMGLAGVGVTPINIVGLAFGLASNTFTNIQSGLLMEVDKSTVETVVIANQNNYRQFLPTQGIIDNRAAAVYVLRSYLRICTPYTIANQINTTVTLVHSGAGPAAPLINPAVVRSIGPVFTPATVVQLPRRPQLVPPGPIEAKFFQEKDLSQNDINFALSGLCLNKNNIPGMTQADLIKALLQIYESYRVNIERKPVPTPGVIGPQERQEISSQSDCGTAKNFYERRSFANTEQPDIDNAGNINDFATGLLNRAPGVGPIPSNPTLAKLRGAIKTARTGLIQSQKMTPDVPDAMNDQVTPALVKALQQLPQPH